MAEQGSDAPLGIANSAKIAKKSPELPMLDADALYK